jgi:Uma2 family endonuclease
VADRAGLQVTGDRQRVAAIPGGEAGMSHNSRPSRGTEMAHSKPAKRGWDGGPIRQGRQSRSFTRRGKLPITVNNGSGVPMNVAIGRERTRISVNRYQKMVAAGVLNESDRIELIDGDLIDMAPIGPKHAAITARLTKQFVLQVGDEAIVSPGGPVNLGEYSEPQPDVMLLRPRDGDYSEKLPEATDVLLIVEVSDSTLAFDQGAKCTLYARHGVLEYWVIDVEGKRVLVHRDPMHAGYARTLQFSGLDSVTPLLLPAVQLKVQTLFR